MGSKKLGCIAAFLALVAIAASAPTAAANETFRPRIGRALGIIPRLGSQETAVAPRLPVVYHGGAVLHGVTIHTVFWAPSGYHFDGPPPGAKLSYEQLIQQFFTDVAHDSGADSNVFSVLREYPDLGGAGSYSITYTPSADSIDATDPYPSSQCPSPAGVKTCVTDFELQHELDKVIRRSDPAGRSLHDIWMIFLPPDVDTCISIGFCGTNVFAGYHSLSNVGGGPFIYAVVVDPLIELNPPPGSDPEGNPDAELAAGRAAAHESVEAITDPLGTGWYDPNGFEVGDRCDTQFGTPLGYASNGSPYNQQINSDPYWVQMMWSNDALGCVQRSSATRSPLPLPRLDLRQFSPNVSGNMGRARSGIPVFVGLFRAGNLVAVASSTTRGDGSWGPVALADSSGRPRGAGDDREVIEVQYGPGGPSTEVIATGDGGNPFTLSGFTGWVALDRGYAVNARTISLAPCFQVGILSVTIDGTAAPPVAPNCDLNLDVATLHTRTLSGRDSITMTSEDNRAVNTSTPNGVLVRMTIPLGEPNSVAALGNPLVNLQPSGFPSCATDLRTESVRCTGLVPGARYAITRLRGRAVRHARADGQGAIALGRFPGRRPINRGDTLVLSNGTGRTLTKLHVAHLRVDLKGSQSAVTSGQCEPGEYYGPPLTEIPVSAQVGVGIDSTGTICPSNGSAAGLSASDIGQTDDLSGGRTVTEVPDIESTSPNNDETVYGPFFAFAQPGLPGPGGSVIPTGTPVALAVRSTASGQVVFRARNVDKPSGVPLGPFPPGSYIATWKVIDDNGDTRTVRTRFFEGS